MDADVLDKKIIADQKKVGGETEYTLKVYGKLDKQAEKEFTVKLVGSEGKCSAFGHATVAVMGFSSSGNPILLTDKGNLELTSKLFRVGANNLQIVNLKTMKREGYLSKSEDLDRSSIAKTHFDSNGNVYFLDGLECFELRKKELLRKVDLKKCESKKTEVEDVNKFDKFKLKDHQKAYELKDSNYIMILTTDVCS